MKINKSKWVPLIIFLVSLSLITFFGFKNPETFQKYSNQIVALITLVYVYLTYEILRETRQNKEQAYINVNFFLCSKLDESFLKSHPELSLNERTQRLVEHFKNSNYAPKDLVFVSVENIGGTNAIEVKLDLEYEKKDLGRVSSQSVPISFGTVKIETKRMELVDSFDNPSSGDHFKIIKCETIFNTVSRKYSIDGVINNNFTKSVNADILDEKVVISFLK